MRVEPAELEIAGQLSAIEDGLGATFECNRTVLEGMLHPTPCARGEAPGSKAVVGKVVVDERANSSPCLQIALGGQALIGQYDGIARHAQLHGQGATGGHAHAWLQPAAENQLAHLLVQLSLQAVPAARVERDRSLHGVPFGCTTGCLVMVSC